MRRKSLVLGSTHLCLQELAGSETQRIIVEKPSIRKKYLPNPTKPRRDSLQSRRSPNRRFRNIQALVAQLDRVLASEAKGRGFDSRRAHHTCMEVGTDPAVFSGFSVEIASASAR